MSDIGPGDRFGRGVVRRLIRLPLTDSDAATGRRVGRLAAELACDCGATYTAALGNLRKGNVRSCRCLSRDLTRERSITHGMKNHYLFGTFERIRSRCYDPTNVSYKNYGGRGISVCREWRHDAPAFLNWVDENLGPRPAGYTLDRIDNDGDYAPGNLRWATRSQQVRNSRRFLKAAS